MIDIRNVAVVRRGQRLFENLNWRLEGHEHWLITGPNGSGKTILLELLSGAIHASQGEVNYDFINRTSWDERFVQRKQTIHYIPAHAIQTFLSHHELFYQQRYYAMGDERIPKVKDIFGDDIDRLHALQFPSSFNIDALLNLEVTRLSNGQLKKVLILKNLVQELPKVVLFDYPFEGLDAESRSELIEFMDYLAKSYGIQLILVDHGAELPSAINRKLVLDHFKIASIEEVSKPTPEVRQIPNASIQPESTDPVVEMKDVTIRYGEKEVIRKFNWKVSKGERWAVTGKNGSGKTTLFSLIFADHPMAYSEKVYLFGKRRGSGESIWDIKKRITYIGPELISYLNPQHFSMTARSYLSSQNKSANTAALENLVNYFQAHTFIDRPVKSLSSGELQLMLIIGAFLSDKELLLLDEPFQFLDGQNKERLSHYLQTHLHQDTTLILITHYEKDIAHWTQKRITL
jgi:molybdate transport system ATP-binding protein